MVAEEFSRQMAAKGVTVGVHHIRDARPQELPPADVYLFSSPGPMGKPVGGIRRFLKKVGLPAGTRYAILTTELAPQPDKKTGRVPTEEELAIDDFVHPSAARPSKRRTDVCSKSGASLQTPSQTVQAAASREPWGCCQGSARAHRAARPDAGSPQA